MFNYLYRKSTLQIILAVALAAFALARLILAPAIFHTPHAQGLLYPALYNSLFPYTIGFRIAFAIVIALQIFIFQHFISKHNFLDSGSLMPTIWMLFFVLATTDFPAFSQPLITNFLILILLLLNVNSLNSSSEDNRRHVFWSGFIVALAALFEPAAILLFFIVCAALVTGKTNFLKRLCLALSGLLLPFIYIISFYFLTNQTPLLQDYFSQQNFFEFIFIDCKPTIFIIFCIIFLLSILYTIPTLKLHYDNRIILLRKKFLLVNVMFLVILTIILIGNHNFMEGLTYLTIPFSIYFPMLCQLRRNRITADIVMTAVVAIIVLIKVLA